MYREHYKDGQLKKAVKMTYPKYADKKVISKFNLAIYSAASFAIIEQFNFVNATRKDYPYLRFLPDPPAKPNNDIGITASFDGGLAGFYKYIQQNLRYPAEAHKKGIQGKVFVEFVIETDGSVSNVKVIRGIGGGCDQEAQRVIRNSPKWNPGKNDNGELMRQRMELPITFKLG